ncbi:MAG: DUF952 domain-containing protein [Actinomycetota bacterium]|nr:DUF952 domain-containing protein [Actinomycetota bacterium]
MDEFHHETGLRRDELAGDSTLHLTPVEAWERQRTGPAYVPEAYEQDGFVHTTIGIKALLDVANMFYTSDLRPHIALLLDLESITAEIRHDDASGLYPHIYGPINVDAVLGFLVARRSPDGAFVSFERP